MGKTEIKTTKEIFVFRREEQITPFASKGVAYKQTFAISIEINYSSKRIKFIHDRDEEQTFMFRDPQTSKVIAELLKEATEFAYIRLKNDTIN